MNVVAHGVDLVSIERIERLLDVHGDRFRDRVFTPQEQTYADATPGRRGERFAARFACKEAVMKALGTGWRSGIAWRDIGVVNEPSGRPTLRVEGHSARLAAEMGIGTWLVSLSHAAHRDGRGYAVASVLALG